MKYLPAFLALGAAASPTLDKSLAKRQLSSRQFGPPIEYTGGNCGLFSTADPNDTGINLDALGSGTCTVGPNQCIRMGCYNTSGVYLCNDVRIPFQSGNLDVTWVHRTVLTTEQTDEEVSEICDLFAHYGEAISDSCGGYDGESVSGQAFDARGWNVVIAFADCSEPTDTKPSSYTPPGPNGPPGVTCNAAGTSCVQEPPGFG